MGHFLLSHGFFARTRAIVILALCLGFLSYDVAASETERDSNNSEGERDGNHEDPEFDFECIQYQQESPTIFRPDMPSGDFEIGLRCWIENLNDYNVTVNISAPISVSVYDWNHESCQPGYYSGIGDFSNPYWWTPCNPGIWMIVDGGHYEFNLQPHDVIDRNWTISLENVADMDPGFHIIDISAKVTSFGEDSAICHSNCSTIIQSSIHELGSWWRMDWHIAYPQNEVCFYYPYHWSGTPVGSVWDCDLEEEGGLSRDVYVSSLWDFCWSEPKYGSGGYYHQPWGAEQWVTTCEPRIESGWQDLFQSSELDQALMFHGGFAEIQLGRDISGIHEGFWDDTTCPDDSIEAVVISNYQGNIFPAGTWQVGVLAHGYNFSDSSWETSVLAAQRPDLTNLLETNETSTVLEFNLTQMTVVSEHDYIFIEYIVQKGGSHFTSGIIGDCLTASGITSIQEVIDNAELTMGQSGSLYERLSNSLQWSMEIHGEFTVISILVLIAGVIPLAVGAALKRGGRIQKDENSIEDTSDMGGSPANSAIGEGFVHEGLKETEPGAVWWDFEEKSFTSKYDRLADNLGISVSNILHSRFCVVLILMAFGGGGLAEIGLSIGPDDCDNDNIFETIGVLAFWLSGLGILINGGVFLQSLMDVKFSSSRVFILSVFHIFTWVIAGGIFGEAILQDLFCSF